jgi:hypothetical protein
MSVQSTSDPYELDTALVDRSGVTGNFAKRIRFEIGLEVRRLSHGVCIPADARSCKAQRVLP